MMRKMCAYLAFYQRSTERRPTPSMNDHTLPLNDNSRDKFATFSDFHSTPPQRFFILAIIFGVIGLNKQ